MSDSVRCAAVVVVHGMGRQAPLASAARVAQGLVDALDRAGAQGVTLTPGVRRGGGAQRDGPARPFVRLQAARREDLGGFDRIEVHEFAWQRLIAGRARPLAVLLWVLRTGLAPLHLRRFWRVLEGGSSNPWGVVGRSLLWTSLLLLAIVVLSAGLIAALRQLPALLLQLQHLWGAAPPGPLGFEGLLLALGLLAALLSAATLVALLGDALEVWRLQRTPPSAWEGRFAGRARSWAPVALATALGLGLLAAALIALAREPAAALMALLWGGLAAPGVAPGLAAAVGLLLLGRWLRTHLGDVALYVRGDIDSAHVHTRALLQGALLQQLEELLGSAAEGGERIDRLVLMGHSLGSVLALDALDLLAARHPTRSDPLAADPLAPLAGLLTFGSPLDKVAYFFHERIPDGEAVHAQLARFWRGSRRAPDGGELGRYRFAATPERYAHLHWLHLHTPSDPISDPLVFYRPDEVRTLTGVPLWRAHGAPWHDPRTYAALHDLLAKLRGTIDGNPCHDKLA